MTDTRVDVALAEGTAADVGAVDRVMQAAFDPRFGEAWTPAQCLGMLSLPGVWLTLARAGDALVGFALTRAVADDAELLLIAVLPDQRGHGIGRALLRRAIEEAGTRGAARLCLEMREDNDATRLYVGEGFTKCGERRNYYAGRGGARFDAHTYIRPIPLE
ncbi:MULTISPECIES: ribosomal protein S18-alanine N-acetyltransferase [unclassified Sphingomonas]|uniref:ribosomal protein S18-alanine N-acetyltransferase n=1 Tax=unclassified Sphingomonas TaxID=196159 RepID=UPI0006FA314A|nr:MULTISPECIES: ribosomal protein S18-alanine N-acetyltransferase [unclassified Sphingomonas]KQM61524.1 ribosomal-protein-alanine acetyltransferase [Sphingomonas sp. Leaf16]KQN12620.1 ribosomal-protein-alanine acetyltransferase [Sphingomonas sp. Leaf29]KQN19099.1 ribosomal-protein-alanine acetyltransferase [Sphingomonas sp. Leaf32]